MRAYDRNADGDLRSRTLVDVADVDEVDAEWIDPGYCAHGMTIGVRCRYCDGPATKAGETPRRQVA